MGFWDTIDALDDTLKYKRGYDDALNGRKPSILARSVNAEIRDAYNNGYDDGLRERQLRALENRK